MLLCSVVAHDAARGLSWLGFAGGELQVPLRLEPAGTRLRLRLRARDVSVATERPRGISSHNILPGTIAGIVAAGAHEAFVTLQVGPTPLLARLTRDAVDRLALLPGMAVFAMVKSTAFDHG